MFLIIRVSRTEPKYLKPNKLNLNFKISEYILNPSTQNQMGFTRNRTEYSNVEAYLTLFNQSETDRARFDPLICVIQILIKQVPRPSI